jgi:hypothetical protein
MVMPPIFIITIDTEGDNLWANPQTVTTENANFLPRFQKLCEQYYFKPTYLVNYEMAQDEQFQSFGRNVLQKQTGEIGLHIHPWNSPPLNESHTHYQNYLFELSDAMLEAKIDFLHDLLKRTFGIEPVSHRAGRWGFDGRVARALVQRGYLVDCSVTPGVSWAHYKGNPEGSGGSDYTDFPYNPYFMNLDVIRQSNHSPLLQVPVTIRPNFNSNILALYRGIKEVRVRYLLEHWVAPSHDWLRPDGRNLNRMIKLVDRVLGEGAPVLEFMLHSSELMPGGSPLFSTKSRIEKLYNTLSILFEYIASTGAVGMTLAEYRLAGGVPCAS